MFAHEISAQGAHRTLIGARRSAYTQIDAAGVKRRESSKLFSNYQRGMVGQHDAARAHANRVRCAGDVADNDRCGGAGDARHVVMFGEPISAIAPRFSMTG